MTAPARLAVAALLAVVLPSAAAAQRVGEGAWANFDFVPGPRVLFAEDFSRDRVGNFPQRLEFEQGELEVVEWRGKRYLRASAKSTFKIPLPEKLPPRFTVELDLTIPWWGLAVYGGPDGEVDEGSVAEQVQHAHVYVSGSEAGVRRGEKRLASVDPRSLFGGHDDFGISGRPVKLRIHADGKYLKVYLDEHRIANVPNADFVRSNALYVELSGFPAPGEAANIPTLVGAISVNAGGREMYDALVTDGRVVTQGIYFDTGSDRIRPESGPTLKEIAAMLSAHPELSIRIEGHTDAVGNAAGNQALSEKRAAAVKAHLVGAGVAAGRLEARGLGATKPVASNDSPEGRQSNRRVELVKL